MVMENIIYTKKQEEAITKATIAVWEKKAKFSIGGYAGTGKTTVLKTIIHELDSKKLKAMPCAFTGKAALRMRQKGVYDASTIHSLIYRYDQFTHNYFKRHEVDGDYFLIDEASMISSELWKDLQSFNLPCVLIGDIGQLEPVGDDPKLLSKCDIVLDEIHRQDKDSGIITFATNVRTGVITAFTDKNAYTDVSLKRLKDITPKELVDSDVIICGLNKTRQAMNDKMRAFHERKDEINYGDKIICLSNNSRIGVFNGEIFTVEEVHEKRSPTVLKVKVRCCDDTFKELPLYREQLNNPKNLATSYEYLGVVNGRKEYKPLVKDAHNYVFADFGYCITCHKSQGSEWENVLVIDEQIPKLWDSARWRYTAITRAAKKLTYIL